MLAPFQSLSWVRALEDTSRRASYIHSIHPVAAIAVTAGFLATVMSFGRYDAVALTPLLSYPALVIAIAGIPPGLIARPLVLIEPFIVIVGLANLWFDQGTAMVAGIAVPRGWLALMTLVAKTALAVAGALLLAAILGAERLAAGMRQLRIPKIFVLQLLLTFRYIWVLMEEAGRLATAYFLRAGGRRNVAFRDWGAVAGGLLLRTYERAERVHQAMLLRGFDGECRTSRNAALRGRDWLYIACWLIFFAFVRSIDVPELLGTILTGAYSR